ncbi:uncharacterized protein LOC127712276 isoform X2 [Mytilus californianus]|uniref:uncharacterized protein LOC127712276 isoform X2 n=1 Tax=Mytilus californianus TaxID=6549 RepID=UPI0022473D38|nr:uncharacterized protein LOC127712276 isoform X2 [Mytilus californianus]
MVMTDVNYCIELSKIEDIVYGTKVKMKGYKLFVPLKITTADAFRIYKVVVTNANGQVNISIDFRSARPLSAPQNIRAVGLDRKIIVKWTANNDIGLEEHFFVEYRTHFESLWGRVSAKDRSTAIINGLKPDEVYFLRVYSKTAAGESIKTDVVIVKTEKQHSKVQVFTVEFALLLGAVFLMMFVCWCGMKALKNKQWSCRNQDRGTLPRRNEELSARPDHYDEIDSMYYNPINLTIYPQNTTRNAQFETRRLSIDNNILEDPETYNSSKEKIRPRNVHEWEHSREDNSPRSSSEESYLVPCRNYIDFDLEKVNQNEQQERSADEPGIHVDELSISSDDSETNTKSIRTYEILKLSDINGHSNRKNDSIVV